VPVLGLVTVAGLTLLAHRRPQGAGRQYWLMSRILALKNGA
jgi:hypothetical protein